MKYKAKPVDRQDGAAGAVDGDTGDGKAVSDYDKPDYDERGVDFSLIRWMLSLTPAERLAFLQRHVNAVLTVRRLNGGE